MGLGRMRRTVFGDTVCRQIKLTIPCSLRVQHVSASVLALFSSCRDEVLLEVSFAAIWIAVAHRTNQRMQQQQDQDPQHSRLSQLTSLTDPKQQQQQTAQHLNTATLLLCKWLLFRLLLVTSTFSATYLCGQNPVLQSCWKTIAAHGLPHVFTR
jgi:hypothetical protein